MFETRDSFTSVTPYCYGVSKRHILSRVLGKMMHHQLEERYAYLFPRKSDLCHLCTLGRSTRCWIHCACLFRKRCRQQCKGRVLWRWVQNTQTLADCNLRKIRKMGGDEVSLTRWCATKMLINFSPIRQRSALGGVVPYEILLC